MKAHREVFRRRGEVFYRIDRPRFDAECTDYLVTKSAAAGYFIKGGCPLPAEFTFEADKLFAEAKIWNSKREEDK
jgi:hypothetical protein